MIDRRRLRQRSRYSDPLRSVCWGSKTGVGELFSTSPDRPECPPSFLHNGHRFSFMVVKVPGRGVGNTHQQVRGFPGFDWLPATSAGGG
jgi:hypothetical protein